MAYLVLVDESGEFSKDADTSVVGGLVTELDHVEAAARMQAVLTRVNNQYGTAFGVEHVHIAPLLHPHSYRNKTAVDFLRMFRQEEREALAEACLVELRDFATHFFYSVNRNFNFAASHMQTRYGTNLLAALGLARQYLDVRTALQSATFLISTRSQRCLDSGEKWGAYHRELCSFLSGQLGAQVYYASPGKHDVERAWADVACYYLSQEAKSNAAYFAQDRVSVTTPTEALLWDATRLSNQVLDVMLGKGEYCQAYRMADTPEKRREILTAIAKTTFSDGLVSELTGMVLLAERLIRCRTTEAGALNEALDILNAVTDCAAPAVEEHSGNRDFMSVCLSVMECVIECHNHLGITGQQREWVKSFETLMAGHGVALGSAALRRERTLGLRNRAYNDQFNDFRFSEIVEKFEADVEERVRAIGNEKDDLTGEMCGTIGQAYAFMARLDPALSNNAAAHFERSLGYFSPAHRYHNMGVNYLAALHWQSRDLDKALAALSHHPYFNGESLSAGGARDVIETWLDRLRADRFDEPNTPFDVLSLLRLLALLPGDALPKGFDRANAWLWEYPAEQHPHQLIAKWMGALHLSSGNFGWARGWFRRAETMAAGQGLTIEATFLPVLGLWAVTERRADGNHETVCNRLWTLAAALQEKSAAFSDYLEAIGGLAVLRDDVANEDIDAISRWMPFGYA